MRPATNAVLKDEPAYSLLELVLPAPDYRGHHRYQIITVVRNDKLADFKMDMGLASKYKADQLQIIGGVTLPGGRIEICETVARLRAQADGLRNRLIDKTEWPVIDIFKSYDEHCDKKKKKGVSKIYGYGR